MNLQDLSAQFPPEVIHWRAQTITKDGTKALALGYIDARDVMDRLDQVCGPFGWQDSYTETPKGRVICTISILSNDGVWIAKSDGAGDTAVEGDKGGISDAFKRAAVKWGIGRYLYDLGNIWANCKSRNNYGKIQWAGWADGAQQQFTRALLFLATPSQPAERINDDQVTRIMDLLEGHNIPIADLLKAAKIDKLTDMEASRVEGAMGWINRAIQAKTEKETT